ncbi:MAG: serine/threonine transporter SstT [Oscillospiraceae bacterium]|nr:serine/threonine transporter SstT [Oscillospiraceae bacterium]
MKKLYAKYTSVSLIIRIVIGLALGLILALVVPGASAISLFGTVFVGSLKAVAPILVAILIMASLAQSNAQIGKRFLVIIVLYMVATFLAAAVAVIASSIFPVTLRQLAAAAENAAPEGIGEVFTTLLKNIVANPISSLSAGNYLGILFWSVIIGMFLRSSSATTKQLLTDLSDAVSATVRFVIEFAPFGIMGLMFEAISTSGLAIFTDYGKLLLVLVGCMLFSALVINPIIVWFCIRRNPYPLVFRCLRESGVTAFFTRSSAANIPVNMALCEKLGLDKDVYSVSIPLGATINMSGAAVTITVMALATVHTQGIPVYIPLAILLSVCATLGACGTSGVAGGSLLLIPMACSLFGISNDIAMQVVAVGFIIGVIQDSVETALNSSSDALFTAAAEFRDWRKQGKEIRF